MPTAPTAVPSEASRRNGAVSAGPAPESGKARSTINSTRHGRTGRTFFLLADEDSAMKALSPLLRHRAQITRENAAAMRDLGSLRQRRLDLPQPPRQSEPEAPPLRATAVPPPAASSAAPSRPPLFTTSKGAMAALPSEPETTLNRHQRRALAARARHAA